MANAVVTRLTVWWVDRCALLLNGVCGCAAIADGNEDAVPSRTGYQGIDRLTNQFRLSIHDLMTRSFSEKKWFRIH